MSAKSNRCCDCDAPIARTATRCRKCYNKYAVGEKNPCYKEDKIERYHYQLGKKCLSCGETISDKATYCVVCSGKNQTGENHHHFNHNKIKKVCADCGIEISGRATRCRSCAAKIRNKNRTLGPVSNNPQSWSTRTSSLHIPGLANWRQQVLARDFNRCVRCNSKKRLHVHHIKSWAKHPESRLDINNGTTLCETCHTKLHRLHGQDVSELQYNTFAIKHAKRKRLVKNLLATAALILLFAALG